MTLSTPDSIDILAETTFTSLDDWRPFLEKRLPARRPIAMPEELRLILITTTVVLLLVALGVQVASALGIHPANYDGSQGHLSTTTMTSTWRPDGICYATSAPEGMLSAAELASAHTPGVREVQPDVFRSCQLDGLAIPQPLAGAPGANSGQVILVSLSQQWLWAYQDGALVFANPVATGMPGLRTPLGTFHVGYKLEHVTFYSPWPNWSSFYYPPEQVTYALHFRAGGFYIHDSPWRQMYGPGAQNPHTNPDGAWETGSHGCVNMTTSAVAWLYDWAQVGATVQVVE